MEFLSLHVNAYYCDYPFKRMSRITCSSFFRIASHRIHIDSYGQSIPIRDRQSRRNCCSASSSRGKKADFWASEVRKSPKKSRSPLFPPCGIIYLSFLLCFSCSPERERNDKTVIMDDEVYLLPSSVPLLENKRRKDRQIVPSLLSWRRRQTSSKCSRIKTTKNIGRENHSTKNQQRPPSSCANQAEFSLIHRSQINSNCITRNSWAFCQSIEF